MIVMLSGVLIGYILRNIRAIPALVSKINIYIIFLLLFVMGLSVGSNPQVIQGLGTLGLLGIAISVVSIATKFVTRHHIHFQHPYFIGIILFSHILNFGQLVH